MAIKQSERDRKILFLELRDLLLDTSSSLKKMVVSIKKENLEERLALAFSEGDSFMRKLWDLEAEICLLDDFKKEDLG